LRGFRIPGGKTLSGNFAQRADGGVSVFAADFTILVAVAIVETCLAMLLSIVPTASSRRDRMATKLRSRNGIIRTMRGEATDQLRDCQIGRNSQSVLAIAHGWDAFFSRVALDAAFP
jgi:hypothetical protein